MTEGPTPDELLLAVDGGASKTDVWLLTADGRIVGSARGEGSNHQFSGLDGAMDALGSTVQAAVRDAGRSGAPAPVAGIGVYCMAGLDLPVDEERLTEAIESRGWTATTTVFNDSLAVLRAGAQAGWGVAVVCGSGLNCVGLGPDGSVVRFPSLGELSGDLAAGGSWLGVRALGLALRSGDGRGRADGADPSWSRRTSTEAIRSRCWVRSTRVRCPTGDCSSWLGCAWRPPPRGTRWPPELWMRWPTRWWPWSRPRRSGSASSTKRSKWCWAADCSRASTRRSVGASRPAIRKVVPRARFRRLDAAPVLGAALLALDAVRAPAEAEVNLRREAPSGGVGPE